MIRREEGERGEKDEMEWSTMTYGRTEEEQKLWVTGGAKGG